MVKGLNDQPVKVDDVEVPRAVFTPIEFHDSWDRAVPIKHRILKWADCYMERPGYVSSDGTANYMRLSDLRLIAAQDLNKLPEAVDGVHGWQKSFVANALSQLAQIADEPWPFLRPRITSATTVPVSTAASSSSASAGVSPTTTTLEAPQPKPPSTPPPLRIVAGARLAKRIKTDELRRAPWRAADEEELYVSDPEYSETPAE